MVAVALGDDALTLTAEVEGHTRRAERSRRASGPLVTGERYELGASIGRGGMGEVFAAYDVQIGREVAIKRMHEARPSHEELSRFLREARIQGRLEHPAIPPVHELGTDAEGRPYFVMKKLGGVTLHSVLRSDKPTFTRHQLLRAFVEVCRALELAHSRGVVHRDLKPANVLLGEHGEVYVLDWGIARELDFTEPPGSPVFGTPAYMAPEQHQADPTLDARADVFSLGCVLYEILTLEQLRPHANPVPPSRDDVPPELEVLWRRATLPDRGDRIQTARSLASSIERYLDGDRDFVHRRQLAESHLEAAHAALAAPADEGTRRQLAMRAAGRAVALDPTLHGAAQLVGHLMMTPPATMPSQVLEEIKEVDEETDRKQIRAVSNVALIYIVMIPVLWAFGMRDVPYLSAWALFSVANFVIQRLAVRNATFMRKGWPLAVITTIGGMALVTRMFTPFLIAPGVVAVSLMSFAMSALARDKRVVIVTALMSLTIVLGMWLLEVFGVLSKTMFIQGNALVLRPPVEGLENFPVLPLLAIYVVSLVGSAASVAHVIARDQYRAREQLQLQSWQLRQIL